MSAGLKLGQLVVLKLPQNFHPTGALLKGIAAKNPSIEHLSLSSPCCRITADGYSNPFGDFAKLKSVSVGLGYDVIECHKTERPDPKSIGAVFDGLQITSLELSGPFSRLLDDGDESDDAKHLIPSQVTTPNLIGVLIHLRIDYFVTVKDAEYLLFHCRRLETLRLGSIFDCDEYPPLITSRHQMSPLLRTITLGFVEETDIWVRLGAYGSITL